MESFINFKWHQNQLQWWSSLSCHDFVDLRNYFFTKIVIILGYIRWSNVIGFWKRWVFLQIYIFGM
jgi:hypothetical protein